MPSFHPLLEGVPLPKVGSAVEQAVFDFKTEPAKDPFEMAKDVAAFANHLGGTLLFGAVESGGFLQRYTGLELSAAGKIGGAYSDAIADRCSPRPTFDQAAFGHPTDSTKKLIAINVSPSVRLISVKTRADKSREGYGGDAFVFPVRTGKISRYIEPQELAMYMTPEIRRRAIMLARIPMSARVYVIFRPDNDASTTTGTYFFQGVEEEANLVRLKSEGGGTLLNMPLDRVISVFEGADRTWRVLVPSVHGQS